MLLLKSGVLIFWTVAIVFVVTQILWPLIMGRQILPMWNKKKKKLEKDLAVARDEIDNATLIRQAREAREQAEKIRNDEELLK